jgi:hypothetical protein
VKQLPQPRQVARSRSPSEDDLYADGTIFDDAPKNSRTAFVDDKRPFDFGIGRYK